MDALIAQAADPIADGVEVLRVEIAALQEMAADIGADFEDAARLIAAAEGRVIVSGMGKSGHVARKIAATLASTGTPSLFLHPSEASHGDLGMVTRGDVCLVISNSGETSELHSLLAFLVRFGIPMIAITRETDSTLARQSAVTLRLPAAREACSVGMAPTTSTTCQIALGDALAVAVMKMKGFDKEDFHVFHPGGKLGAQFTKVRDLMHKGRALPRVHADQPMSEVLLEMTSKGLGVAALVDAKGHLQGIITDGDLRRNMGELMDRTAGDVATRNPSTISPEALAPAAMARMSELKVSALPVTHQDGRLAGMLHIHDCLRAGVK